MLCFFPPLLPGCLCFFLPGCLCFFFSSFSGLFVSLLLLLLFFFLREVGVYTFWLNGATTHNEKGAGMAACVLKHRQLGQ